MRGTVQPKIPLCWFLGFFFSIFISFIWLCPRDLHYIMRHLWSWCTDSLAVAWAQWSQQAGTWSLRGTWDLISPTRDWTYIPCTARRILNPWTTRELLHAYVLFPLFRQDLEYDCQPPWSVRIRTQVWQTPKLVLEGTVIPPVCKSTHKQ